MNHCAIAVVALLLCSSSPAYATIELQENTSALVASGRARLEQCRRLFSSGRENEALELGLKSIDIFIAPYPELRRIDIGHIITQHHLIVVYLNTTEDERRTPEFPITRPYSFFVYTKEKEPLLLWKLDFEHGFKDGKLVSAAIGREVTNRHINYGLINVRAKFSDVKKRVLEVIEKLRIDDET